MRQRHEHTATVTLVIAVLALVGAALAVAGLGASSDNASASAAAVSSLPGSCSGGAAKMTVQGSGLATGTPDLLTLSLSVNVTGASAQSALADDNTKTQAVIASLVSGGVPQHDIQTTNLSINPNYTYSNGTPILAGYAASDSVVAQLHDFAKAGSVIDAASGAGGNAVQISSLSFSIEDPRPLQDKARHDAVAQAVSHAAAMAAAAGEHLGPVCSLTDHTTTETPQGFQNQDFAAAGTAAPAVPLEAGTQQESAQVTLVYELVPPAAHHQ